MYRRAFIVVAVVAAGLAPPAVADEPGHDRVRASIARFAPRLELTELFARFSGAGIAQETDDGVNAPAVVMDVLVARLDQDGKPVTVCVDNEASARRFLDAPIERVLRNRTREQ